MKESGENEIKEDIWWKEEGGVYAWEIWRGEISEGKWPGCSPREWSVWKEVERIFGR